MELGMELRFKWFNYVVLLTAFCGYIAHTKEKKEIKDITFKKAQIQVAHKKIQVEIAQTPQQHQRGLMYREKLDQDGGMLFIFEKEDELSFWMKNTYVDLSIAYIDKNKKIVDIQEMKATSKMQIVEPPTYPSLKPAQYALEMNQGWFKKNKIKIGDKITLPENVK